MLLIKFLCVWDFRAQTVKVKFPLRFVLRLSWHGILDKPLDKMFGTTSSIFDSFQVHAHVPQSYRIGAEGTWSWMRKTGAESYKAFGG